MKIAGISFSISIALWLVSCGKQESDVAKVHFTHVDSLTETYLILQDSLLHTWNVLMKDENEKLKNMQRLLDHMLSNEVYDQDQIQSLKQRLEQLERIRFSQKTMVNPHLVEEYDFASNSLIAEIISLAEADPRFDVNPKLRQWSESIKLADQRVDIYREEYDLVVNRFNQFVTQHQSDLKKIDKNWEGEKKPTFSEQETELDN